MSLPTANKASLFENKKLSRGKNAIMQVG